MTIKVKKNGAYAAPAGIFVKKNGLYAAVQNIYAKVGGMYQSVMASAPAPAAPSMKFNTAANSQYIGAL